MNRTFISDYTYQNETWKLYQLEEAEILNYFSKSNLNNLTNDDLKLYDSEDVNCYCMNKSNKIIYSILDKKEIKILCAIDNQFYDVYDVIFNYKDAPVVLLYCNENDPFICLQTSSYMDIQYLIYLNKKEILRISNSCCDHNYYFDNLFYSINYSSRELYTLEKKLNFKKFLFFGFNFNMGHQLWNEISGLSIFLENNLFYDKIEGIIIGPYDYFNVELYLKNNFNFKIFKFEDVFSKCSYNCNINLKDIFPIFLNSHYIDYKVTNILNYVYNNSIEEEYKEEEKYNHEKVLEISYNLRTDRRALINQDEFFINLTKKILIDYKDFDLIIVNLIGYTKFNINHLDIEYEECLKQNNIVRIILDFFHDNPKVVFNNLVGKSFYDVRKQTIKSKITVSPLGTSVGNLINYIWNTKLIFFGPKEAYQWKNITYDVLKNYDIIFAPIECITTDNGLQGPFNIDLDLYYDFFKNKLNELL